MSPSNLRRLSVLSICIGTVLGALQTLTYGRVLADDLRDTLGIDSDNIWSWIISSLIWSLILASVSAVMLRGTPVRSNDDNSQIQSRIVAIFLSITAVVAGFFTGPFFGELTKNLPFIDPVASHEATKRILAYLRVDLVNILDLFWSIILAVLGYGLARRPPLAAAFAGFCFSLYTAALAIIAIDHIWLSGKDPHSPVFPVLSISVLGLCGISMTVGGYRLGRWLLRQS